MKALSEYILTAVFTSIPWTVEWKPKGVTTQMKVLSEYILTAVFTPNSRTIKWKRCGQWTERVSLQIYNGVSPM